MPKSLKEILGEYRYNDLLTTGKNSLYFGVPCSDFSFEDLLVIVGHLGETSFNQRVSTDAILQNFSELEG